MLHKTSNILKVIMCEDTTASTDLGGHFWDHMAVWPLLTLLITFQARFQSTFGSFVNQKLTILSGGDDNHDFVVTIAPPFVIRQIREDEYIGLLRIKGNNIDRTFYNTHTHVQRCFQFVCGKNIKCSGKKQQTAI